MSLSKYVNNLIKKELTPEDIIKMTYNTVPVIIDNSLKDETVMKDTIQLTLEKKAIILLLLNDISNSGHYVTITINDKQRKISFYDPYGFHPEFIAEKMGNELTTFISTLSHI